MNRVTVRKREARSGGLTAVDYILVFLGIAGRDQQPVAWLACPRGSVADVNEDLLVSVDLLWVLTAAKERDQARLDAARKLVQTARRISYERLVAARKKWRQRMENGSESEDETEEKDQTASPGDGDSTASQEAVAVQQEESQQCDSGHPASRTRSGAQGGGKPRRTRQLQSTPRVKTSNRGGVARKQVHSNQQDSAVALDQVRTDCNCCGFTRAYL
jgi:hypothetical protein